MQVKKPACLETTLSYNPPVMAGALQKGRRKVRPLSVTVVVWGISLLGLANGWRAAGIFRQSGLLLALSASPDPRLRALVALFWAIVFVVLAIALWLRWSLVRWAIPGALFLYGLYQIGLIGFFAQTAESTKGWTVNAAIYGVIILFLIWILNRRPARLYFEERNK